MGYFLDHDNFKHDSASAVPNTPSWAHANYTTWMRYIYKMQNLTFGPDGGLTEACQAKHPGAPGLCFMSPHMQVRERVAGRAAVAVAFRRERAVGAGAHRRRCAAASNVAAWPRPRQVKAARAQSRPPATARPGRQRPCRCLWSMHGG